MSDDSDYQRMARLIMNSGKKPQTEPLTSKEDNELIQRVCRGVASIQEGERLRAYIAGLQSALERSQHQITLLVGAGRIPLKRAICARHGQIVETGCPDCERALGRIPVETVQAPSKNGNDLPARLRQLSGIMGGGASHHLNKAALEAADVIDRQRATIEFVNKQIRSVTPDWNAVVRWLDDSLALDGRADETSAAPLFPPTEPWPHSLGEQCLQYWGRIERRCQLTQGHEGACYFCVPAYAIRTDIPLDRLSEKATAYDPGPPDCPHGYWKAHCAICLKTIDEPLDPLCNCPVDSWGIVRCQEDSGIVRCRAEVNAENGTTR